MATCRVACHLPEQVHHRPKWQQESRPWRPDNRVLVERVWRRGSKGLQPGRFLALRARLAGGTPRPLARQAGGSFRCAAARRMAHGTAEPTKYWLANLSAVTPIVELVRLARLRWRVEQDFRELKGASGLDHFEGAAGPAGTNT
jgi:hypothetical protein